MNKEQSTEMCIYQLPILNNQYFSFFFIKNHSWKQTASSNLSN